MLEKMPLMHSKALNQIGLGNGGGYEIKKGKPKYAVE
jgi:hypothetical protein